MVSPSFTNPSPSWPGLTLASSPPSYLLLTLHPPPLTSPFLLTSHSPSLPHLPPPSSLTPHPRPLTSMPHPQLSPFPHPHPHPLLPSPLTSPFPLLPTHSYGLPSTLSIITVHRTHTAQPLQRRHRKLLPIRVVGELMIMYVTAGLFVPSDRLVAVCVCVRAANSKTHRCVGPTTHLRCTVTSRRQASQRTTGEILCLSQISNVFVVMGIHMLRAAIATRRKLSQLRLVFETDHTAQRTFRYTHPPLSNVSRQRQATSSKRVLSSLSHALFLPPSSLSSPLPPPHLFSSPSPSPPPLPHRYTASTSS